MPHLKYLESLIIEEDFHNDDFSRVHEGHNFPSDVSKLKTLSIKVCNIKAENYVNIFQVLKYFSGLNMLHLNVKIDRSLDYTCYYHEAEFVKAKSDFMASHPQCKVCVNINYYDPDDEYYDYDPYSSDDDHITGHEAYFD